MVHLRRLRQTYLGVSQQRMLRILPQRRLPPSLPREKCFLDILPDELLAEILDYFAPATYCSHHPLYEHCLSILLVCKRWLRLYEPMLYRRLDLGNSTWEISRRTSQRFKVLQEHSDIQNHVRAIDIQLRNRPSEATCRMIAAIIGRCKATRILSLQTEWDIIVWPIIHAVKDLPRLAVLRLYGHGDGPSLQAIFAHFKQPTLKELRLCRYGIGRSGQLKAPWLPLVPFSQAEAEEFSRSAHQHTTSVTALELTDPSAPPHITEILLEWPEYLLRLSMTFLANSVYGGQYTLGAIQRILDLHCKSLQDVKIGIIPGPQKGIPDFSRFYQLQKLEISAYDLLDEKPYDAFARLAAPTLRHLTMDFHTEDQHSESSTNFADREVHWLEKFVSCKTSEGQFCKLEIILVKFNPECNSWSVAEEAMTWPWEYLQQAKQILSLQNVTLAWSVPSCTRREWEEMIADRRDARNARNGPEGIEVDF